MDMNRHVSGNHRECSKTIQRALGLTIRARRTTLGMSQEALAYRAGLHRTYISDIENGSRNVSLVNVSRLARALEMTLSQLCKYIEDGPNGSIPG